MILQESHIDYIDYFAQMATIITDLSLKRQS